MGESKQLLFSLGLIDEEVIWSLSSGWPLPRFRGSFCGTSRSSWVEARTRPARLARCRRVDLSDPSRDLTQRLINASTSATALSGESIG